MHHEQIQNGDKKHIIHSFLIKKNPISHLSIPGGSSSPKELSLLPAVTRITYHQVGEAVSVYVIHSFMTLNINGKLQQNIHPYLMTGRWTRTCCGDQSWWDSETLRSCRPADVVLSRWERWRSCSPTCHTDTSCCEHGSTIEQHLEKYFISELMFFNFSVTKVWFQCRNNKGSLNTNY